MGCLPCSNWIVFMGMALDFLSGPENVLDGIMWGSFLFEYEYILEPAMNFYPCFSRFVVGSAINWPSGKWFWGGVYVPPPGKFQVRIHAYSSNCWKHVPSFFGFCLHVIMIWCKVKYCWFWCYRPGGRVEVNLILTSAYFSHFMLSVRCTVHRENVLWGSMSSPLREISGQLQSNFIHRMSTFLYVPKLHIQLFPVLTSAYFAYFAYFMSPFRRCRDYTGFPGIDSTCLRAVPGVFTFWILRVVY